MKRLILKLEIILTVGWYFITHPKILMAYILMLSEGNELMIDLEDELV